MKRKKTHDRPDTKIIAAAAVLAAAAALSIVFGSQIKDLFEAAELESVYAQSEHYALSVYFPDAGSAGCALIHSKDNGDILIDCGREKAQHDILNVLSYLDVENLDIAVLTHPDSDHIGNFEEVADRVPIGQFITCEYSETSTSPLYASLRGKLTEKKVPITYTEKGGSFSVGGITLDVISPDKLYKSSNDNSVVTRLTYNGFTALFTGDITKKAEKDILAGGVDISADLLYVAHHGSSSSSTEEFLRAVSPKIAVISAEEDEYHPSGGVIRRLTDMGCEIYRTDISGTTAVFCDDDGEISVAAEKRSGQAFQ